MELCHSPRLGNTLVVQVICANHLNAVAITPDGLGALTASQDETVRTWTLADLRQNIDLEGHAAIGTVQLAVSADRKGVFSASDQELKTWDSSNGKLRRTLPTTGSANDLVVTPDKRWAITAGFAGIYVYDLAQPRLVTWFRKAREVRKIEIGGERESVDALALTPDGRRLISGSADGTIRIWHFETGAELAVLKGHSQKISALAVTPDGMRVVSGSSDKTLKVWDLETAREVRCLEGHVDEVSALALSGDGKSVVSAAFRTVRRWDLATGAVSAEQQIGDTVRALAVTSDGKRILSVGWNRSVMLWDLDSACFIAKFHCEGITGKCALIGENFMAVSDGSQVYFLALEELEKTAIYHRQASARLRAVLQKRERDYGAHHRETLQVAYDLAMASYNGGLYTRAAEQFRRVMDSQEALLGPDHPTTLLCANNLAASLQSVGDMESAEPILRRVQQVQERVLGPQHAQTLLTTYNLAELLRAKGHLAAAEPLMRTALIGQEQVLGVDHDQTLLTVSGLAALRLSAAAYVDAGALYRRVFESYRRTLGENHPSTLLAWGNYAAVLQKQGDYEHTERLQRLILMAHHRTLGLEHPNSIITAFNLSELLRSNGDFSGAAALYRRTLEASKAVFGHEHAITKAILAGYNQLPRAAR